MSLPATELKQALLALSQGMELVNIRTVEFAARLLEQPDERHAVSIAVDSEMNAVPAPGGFVVEARFTLKARPATEGARDFAELLYRVGAVYRAPGAPPSTEVLEAFARTHGMIHLWPYFRAYVQQACAQLGLRPIILHPFRLVPAPTPGEGGGTAGRN
jgi:hypothetical protein